MAEPDWRQRVAANVAQVRASIAAACARSGRDPAGVVLVAVTKYARPEVLSVLPALGVSDLGENQVQQLVARVAAGGPACFGWPVGNDPGSTAPGPVGGPRPRWHMIGHLQRNKVRQLLPHARILHSLDSDRLAHAIEQHAAQIGVPVDVFIEVNVAGESTKTGVPPDGVEPLVATVAGCPHLRLRGLMTLAPYDVNPEHSRPHFAGLRELLERLCSRGVAGPTCVHLSMGMSLDYMVAVEEGATFVRVGSALFEGLPTADPRQP